MTVVTDSPIFCDETENTNLFMWNCCKQQFSKEALSNISALLSKSYFQSKN